MMGIDEGCLRTGSEVLKHTTLPEGSSPISKRPLISCILRAFTNSFAALGISRIVQQFMVGTAEDEEMHIASRAAKTG